MECSPDGRQVAVIRALPDADGQGGGRRRLEMQVCRWSGEKGGVVLVVDLGTGAIDDAIILWSSDSAGIGILKRGRHQMDAPFASYHIAQGQRRNIVLSECKSCVSACRGSLPQKFYQSETHDWLLTLDEMATVQAYAISRKGSSSVSLSPLLCISMDYYRCAPLQLHYRGGSLCVTGKVPGSCCGGKDAEFVSFFRLKPSAREKVAYENGGALIFRNGQFLKSVPHGFLGTAAPSILQRAMHALQSRAIAWTNDKNLRGTLAELGNKVLLQHSEGLLTVWHNPEAENEPSLEFSSMFEGGGFHAEWFGEENIIVLPTPMAQDATRMHVLSAANLQLSPASAIVAENNHGDSSMTLSVASSCRCLVAEYGSANSDAAVLAVRHDGETLRCRKYALFPPEVCVIRLIQMEKSREALKIADVCGLSRNSVFKAHLHHLRGSSRVSVDKILDILSTVTDKKWQLQQALSWNASSLEDANALLNFCSTLLPLPEGTSPLEASLWQMKAYLQACSPTSFSQELYAAARCSTSMLRFARAAAQNGHVQVVNALLSQDLPSLRDHKLSICGDIFGTVPVSLYTDALPLLSGREEDDEGVLCWYFSRARVLEREFGQRANAVALLRHVLQSSNTYTVDNPYQWKEMECQRTRVSIQRVAPIDYRTENAELIKALTQYSAMA
eukprot:g908.t1